MAMKRETKALVGLMMIALGLLVGTALAGESKEPKFGDTAFMAFTGKQERWPTAKNAQVIKEFSVPIYLGLPDEKYEILGRVYDGRTTGVGVIGRGVAKGLFPEKDRQKDCANQAKFRGGDAVVVTKEAKIIAAFALSEDELKKTTPLFDHPDKLVLVVKFK
jgi:hypothetical protein